MLYKIFTIKDKAADSFLKPIFFENEALVIRELQNCTMDSKHNFHKHASDYSLWQIGDYDDQSSKISTLVDHVCIMQMDDIKNLKS